MPNTKTKKVDLTDEEILDLIQEIKTKKAELEPYIEAVKSSREALLTKKREIKANESLILSGQKTVEVEDEEPEEIEE